MYFRKTFSKYGIASAVLVTMLAVPGVASAALSLEYYTYGGFGDIVSAFNKCALIYSSDAYKTLLPTIWIVSMAVGLISAHLYKLQVAVKDEGVAVSRPEGVYSVLINSLLSVILFSGLIVPKGTLHIYDPTENAYQAVGGIPIVTVVAAGATNLLERSIISLVETSGDPLGYSKQAGSKGVQVLNSLAGGVVVGPQSDANGSGLGASIYKYAQDCVLFELARPGTTLTVGILEGGAGSGSTFSSSFAAAASGANLTVVYDPAIDIVGSPVTCSAAWNSINTRLSGSSGTDSFAKIKKEACDAGGYRVYDSDPAVATTAYNECVTSTDALIKSIDSSGSFNLNKFIVEMYSVYVFKTVLAADSPSLFAGNAMSQRSTSQLQSYLASMPQIRGTITSVLVAILPFVSLLFLTKYWQKALAFLVGAFAFTTIWGIGNAVVNDFYVSASVARWAGVFAEGMGITPFDVFAQSTAERMNVWGLYQVATFTVATSISMMLFGAVGSIAASMAGAGMHTATGDASKGRSGVDAMNREISLSPAQRAATAVSMGQGMGMAYSGEAFPNNGLSMASFAESSGQWGGKQQLLQDNGVTGTSQLNSDSIQASAYTGAAPMPHINNVSGGTGVTKAQAAQLMAGGGVTSSQTISPDGSIQEQLKINGGTQTDPVTGATYGTETRRNTQTGAAVTTVDSTSGTAVISRQGGNWSVDSVKLANSPSSATVGTKHSRTEVAATEIASKMDKEQLFSNTDAYLKSLGWSDQQTKTFKEAWRKQTGYEIGEQTAHRQVNSEGSGTTVSAGASTTISASVGVGTPPLSPVKASAGVTAEGHLGVETNKNKSEQNLVDKSVVGGAKESSSHATDREIAHALSSVITESKDSRFNASLAQKFNLSESSKAAISEAIEESAGAGTTTNLDTYMVNDLLHSDARFQSGSLEANTAAAMKFLDSNTQEARDYKASAKERFLSEYDVVQNTDTAIDKSQNAFSLPEKHENGPDTLKIKQLEKDTAGIPETVKQTTSGAPGVGVHGGIPATPASGGARRTSKRVTEEDPVKLKIRELDNANNNTVKNQTVLPRLTTSTPDPRNVAKDINVHGSDAFTSKGKPTKPDLGQRG